MSEKKLKEQGVLIPNDKDYDKIYGNIVFNPTMITCACGSCNKSHEIEEIDKGVLAELKW